MSVHGKGAYMQVAELTVRPEREEKLRLTQVVKGDGYVDWYNSQFRLVRIKCEVKTQSP